MGISKKGLRKIIVDQQTFYWKFNEKIIITSDEIKNALLILDFGYFDVWLYVNDRENRPPDYEPRVVTPQFVETTIRHAKSIGWHEGTLNLMYRKGEFSIGPADNA